MASRAHRFERAAGVLQETRATVDVADHQDETRTLC
jgi:hypothetical protein